MRLKKKKKVYVTRGAGGGAFGGTLPLTAMLLVCIPVDWNDKRAGHVLLYYFTVRFQGLDGGGRGAGGYLLFLASALLVCMPAGRIANVDIFVFFFAVAVQLSRTG